MLNCYFTIPDGISTPFDSYDNFKPQAIKRERSLQFLYRK